MLEHVDETICGYPIIGSFQGQVAWSLEQRDLMTDVPANGRGIGLGDLWKYPPMQTTLKEVSL